MFIFVGETPRPTFGRVRGESLIGGSSPGIGALFFFCLKKKPQETTHRFASIFVVCDGPRGANPKIHWGCLWGPLKARRFRGVMFRRLIATLSRNHQYEGMAIPPQRRRGGARKVGISAPFTIIMGEDSQFAFISKLDIFVTPENIPRPECFIPFLKNGTRVLKN